ncbi:MAG: nucleotidyltransferase domain-containing protein [Moorella sp. (in: Bacteria)]|nr:nucleotidyltransferase domain-containing protein [Moorella sp. (in: firmicutes)]
MELRTGERRALEEVKRRLKGEFPVERFIVYGSVARGEAREDSDLDLLVIASRPVSHREQYAMVDEVCEVNLEYGSNISLLIVDGDNWERGLLSAMPLRAEVERDGVAI